jgi:hypothetical protein
VKKAVKKIIKKKPAPAKPKAAAKKIPMQKVKIPAPVPAPVLVEEIKEVYFTPEGRVEVTETIIIVDNDNSNSG